MTWKLYIVEVSDTLLENGLSSTGLVITQCTGSTTKEEIYTTFIFPVVELIELGYIFPISYRVYCSVHKLEGIYDNLGMQVGGVNVNNIVWSSIE